MRYVESKVEGGAFPDLYMFKAPTETVIPIGAKVTVEWEENEHRCEGLVRDNEDLTLRRGAKDWWFLRDGGRLCMIDVPYCPGCGVELE